MRWDGTVTIGNVVTVLTMAFVVAIAWATNRERSIANEADIVEIRADLHRIEARLRSLEAGPR